MNAANAAANTEAAGAASREGAAAAAAAPQILHETRRRLRLAVPAERLAALTEKLGALDGVQGVRANALAACIVVEHDGLAATRAAVLARLAGGVAGEDSVVDGLHESDGDAAVAATASAGGALALLDGAARPTSAAEPGTETAAPGGAALLAWTPAALAAMLPLLPKHWRSGGALAVIAARLLAQPDKLRKDAPAVLLDAASLAALALNQQSLVVSASVLLRQLAEQLSQRLVRQADGLIAGLLPEAAASYQVLDAAGSASPWPLRRLRAGDRLRLFAGDVVPVDGCVLDGQARLQPSATDGAAAAAVEVGVGAHLPAGVRLAEGTLELLAEADAASSRLARMAAQLQHALATPEPPGRLAPDMGRLLSLPLTAAALVFGLTGDTARSAAMLQADPQQGLDLALPLAREAALYALARQGLLTGGLEAIERLAVARTLLLQDSGVLASGRWHVHAIEIADDGAGEAAQFEAWLAALAGLPLAALQRSGLADRLLRQWRRHGALLRVDGAELHLADRARLRAVWGQDCAMPPPELASCCLQQELFVCAAGGRVLARVLLRSPWREGAAARLAELAALGFEHIALLVESGEPGGALALPGVGLLGDAPDRRAEDWLADPQRSAGPALIVHTVLRDLVPPGSLSLTPMDADVGAHGLLLGDPLASLVAARRLAATVHRRLRLQQGAAVFANAGLMTASALRWMPPIASALLHHGFALALVLDSLRLESLGREAPAPAAGT